MVYIIVFDPPNTHITNTFFTHKYGGKTLLSLLIFLNCTIIMIKTGRQNFSKLIFLSWGIGVFFIIYSYFNPFFFESIGTIQAELMNEAKRKNMGFLKLGRAFGLYMQPNRAATAICLHLLIILPTYFSQKHKYRILIICISFCHYFNWVKRRDNNIDLNFDCYSDL